MIWSLAAAWVLVAFLLAWVLCRASAPQSDEERRLEDAAQAKYLQARAERLQKARRKPEASGGAFEEHA